MIIYAQLPIVAAIVVYIVDVSGFTDSWKAALAALIKRPAWALKPIKPFDCGLCMTWWCCLIWALIKGQLTLLTAAEAALLSSLSIPIGQILVFIREALSWILDKITPRI
jgi:hypothetical protein